MPTRITRRAAVRAITVTAAVGTVPVLSGCSTGPVVVDPTPTPVPPWLRVVATFSLVGDLARAVGGERVEVRDVMPAGADPHRFRPAETDSALFPSADLVLSLGLGLERHLSPLLDAVAAEKDLVAVGQRIPADQLRYPDALAGAPDPHVWHDPRLWIWPVAAVTEALVAHDPDHRDVYQANSQGFLRRIGDLDAWVTEHLALVPPERRVLVTAHTAFEYLAARFAFATAAPVGFVTEPGPVTGDVGRVAEFVAARDVPVVFPETSVPVAAVEAVASTMERSADPAEVGPLLFSDALGEPDVLESRYIGMVRHNVGAIVGGLLGGLVPSPAA